MGQPAPFDQLLSSLNALVRQIESLDPEKTTLETPPKVVNASIQQLNEMLSVFEETFQKLKKEIPLEPLETGKSKGFSEAEKMKERVDRIQTAFAKQKELLPSESRVPRKKKFKRLGEDRRWTPV